VTEMRFSECGLHGESAVSCRSGAERTRFTVQASVDAWRKVLSAAGVYTDNYN
jgi:dsDNA-binding SOS-regulon protein